MIMLHYSDIDQYVPTHRGSDDLFIVWTSNDGPQSAQIALYDEENEQFITPDTLQPIGNVLFWAELPTLPALMNNLGKEI